MLNFKNLFNKKKEEAKAESKYESDEHAQIIKEVLGDADFAREILNDYVKNKEDEEKFKPQVERNLRGIELEKEGRVEDAIKLYEENVAEDFIGSHPYDRLAVIYKKKKDKENELRILRIVLDKLTAEYGADPTKTAPNKDSNRWLKYSKRLDIIR